MSEEEDQVAVWETSLARIAADTVAALGEEAKSVQGGRATAAALEAKDPLRWQLDASYIIYSLKVRALDRALPSANRKDGASEAVGLTPRELERRFDTFCDEDQEIIERVLPMATQSAWIDLRPNAISTHGLCARLAKLGRTFASDSVNTPLPIVVGNIHVHVSEALTAHRVGFSVDGHRLDLEELVHAQRAARDTRFAYLQNGTLFVCALTRAVVPWLRECARAIDKVTTTPTKPLAPKAPKINHGLAFPAAATAELRAALRPVMARGAATLPESLQDKAIDCTPQAALCIEWKPKGLARVDILIALTPHAPLVQIGEGPTQITFAHKGQHFRVRRNFQTEYRVAEALVIELEPFLSWHEGSGTGHAETMQQCIALAEYLHNNPELRVDIKEGRRLTVTPWQNAETSLKVESASALHNEREGESKWFTFRGHIAIGHEEIPFGDILAAVRKAAGFIELASGAILTIPDYVSRALSDLGQLAETHARIEPDGSLRVHAAFAGEAINAHSVFRDGFVSDSVLAARSKLETLRGREHQLPPFALESGQLRHYQEEGIAWALRLAAWAPGCILADDMGLGKTVQAAVILGARRAEGPALVITPASVGANWKSELAKFMPSLRVRWFYEERLPEEKPLGPGDVLVMSYAQVALSRSELAHIRFGTLILDEAQFLKNADTQRSAAVRSLSRNFTMALTGTPVENHLGDLWGIFELAFPGLLGGRREFTKRFREPIEVGSIDGDGQQPAPGEAPLEQLNRLIAPFVLRRSRDEVLPDLPQAQTILEYVDLDPAHAKRYEALREAGERQFALKDDSLTAAQTQIQILSLLTQLRQLACDASLLDATYEGRCAKIERLTELCSAIADQGDAVLVFSQFTSFLTHARDAMRAHGLEPLYLDGSTPASQRGELVARFQAGESPVFCISLGAGGTGINLTKANYVIHTDPWWNPAVEDQASSRAHRMGQTRKVTTYKLVARGTIEEAILDVHGRKRGLMQAVQSGKNVPSKTDLGALRKLLEKL